MSMYLRINDEEQEQLVKIRNLLKTSNVNFEEFSTALDIFCNEEAPFRIGLYFDGAEEKYTEIEQEKIVRDCSEELTDIFVDDDYIINGEHLENLTNALVEGYLKGSNIMEERKRILCEQIKADVIAWFSKFFTEYSTPEELIDMVVKDILETLAEDENGKYYTDEDIILGCQEAILTKLGIEF